MKIAKISTHNLYSIKYLSSSKLMKSAILTRKDFNKSKNNSYKPKKPWQKSFSKAKQLLNLKSSKGLSIYSLRHWLRRKLILSIFRGISNLSSYSNSVIMMPDCKESALTRKFSASVPITLSHWSFLQISIRLESDRQLVGMISTQLNSKGKMTKAAQAIILTKRVSGKNFRCQKAK